MINLLQSFAFFASNSIPLPVTNTESHFPSDSLSSFNNDDDNEIIQQPVTYDKHYVQADSLKAVLLSIVIGLTNAGSELIFDPEKDEFCKKSNVWKTIKPTSPYYEMKS